MSDDELMIQLMNAVVDGWLTIWTNLCETLESAEVDLLKTVLMGKWRALLLTLLDTGGCMLRCKELKVELPE